MDERPSLLRRLLRFGAWGALGLAVAIWPAYAYVASTAQTLQQIDPVDPALLPANRFAYSEDPTGRDADVVGIYGNPKGAPTAYVLVDEDDVLHPEEKPELALLTAPDSGQPLQLAFVRFVATRASGGALAVALLLFGLGWFLRRRSA